MGDIAVDLAVTRATASDAVAVAERKGLVVRMRDAEDKRVVHVTITSAGRQLAEQGQEGVASLLQTLYYILPNLAIYNIQNQVVYREDIGSIGYNTLLYPFAAILYTAILLIIATISFARRDFK